MTTDGATYMLLGWNLVSGQGYTAPGQGYGAFAELSTWHGPVFPGLLGGLMLLLGRDVESLTWAVRLLALVNPVLMYFLIKRIAGSIGGLLAAAIVALFSSKETLWAFNVDAVELTVFLLAVLALLIAAQRNNAGLSLLSGLLLGTAILTKETSFVALPLAFFTVLLLGWSLRGVVLHYAGVVAACLPWWVWVWEDSGKVFLVENLKHHGLAAPAGPVIPVMAYFPVMAYLSLLGALLVMELYRSGVVARLLANERWRRRMGWFMVLAPTTVLLALLLIAHPGLLLTPFSALNIFEHLYPGYNGRETVPTFIVERLLPETGVWYLLPFAGVYLLWETFRGNRLWEFYSALLVLQIPISVIALGWRLPDMRQWLIPETLLYGALAGLIAKALETSIRRERRNARRSLTFGAAAVLIVALAWGVGSQVRYLLSDDTKFKDANGNDVKYADYQFNQYNPAVRDMHNWIAENVPEKEEIITTPNYAYQLIFLEGWQHGWSIVPWDCALDRSGTAACLLSGKERPIIMWLNAMSKGCNGDGLSFDLLMRNMERRGTIYLLATQEWFSFYANNFAWSPALSDSGAFEIVHSSYLPGAPTEEDSYGLVLLKRTGPTPPPTQPTLMDVDTANQLIACEQIASRDQGGESPAERIRSNFPNGIKVNGNQPEAELAQRKMNQIYKMQ